MASRTDREGAKFTRDDIDRKATALGHAMTWKLAPNSTRKGHCYYFLGECGNCGAQASAGSMWSSCQGIRAARHEPCGGPGTAILTQIEADRVSELIAPAIAEFAATVRRATATLN